MEEWECSFDKNVNLIKEFQKVRKKLRRTDNDQRRNSEKS